jgi:hypothetical protein
MGDPTTLATLQIIKQNVGPKFHPSYTCWDQVTMAYIPIFQNMVGAKTSKLEAQAGQSCLL